MPMFLAILVGVVVLVIGTCFAAILLKVRRQMAAHLAATVAQNEGFRGSSHTTVFGVPITVSNHYQPKPRTYRRNGASHIPHYIERMLETNSPHATVYFYSMGRRRGFSVEKWVLEAPDEACEEAIAVSMMFSSLNPPSYEAAARAFFEERNMSPYSDSLQGNAQRPTRVIQWPVESELAGLIDLSKTILRELCEVSPEEPLRIIFNDRAYQ